MSTDKKWGTVANKQETDNLTTSYGDESGDWTSKGIDVSRYSHVQFKFNYTHQSATLLSFKPYAGDRASLTLDAYYPILGDADGDGAITDVEWTRTVSASEEALLPLLDVRGISMLRLAAKVDDAVDDPSMTLQYLGYNHQGNQVLEQSPDVD